MPSLRRNPLAAVLLLAALHMLTFDRGLGGDGWAGFATLESLADDGDPWVENQTRGVMNGLVGAPGGHLVLHHLVLHHLVMQYPPGILALDALPFLAGPAIDRLLPARPRGRPPAAGAMDGGRGRSPSRGPGAARGVPLGGDDRADPDPRHSPGA